MESNKILIIHCLVKEKVKGLSSSKEKIAKKVNIFSLVNHLLFRFCIPFIW